MEHNMNWGSILGKTFRGFVRGVKRQGSQPDIHHHLLPMLIMRGDILLSPIRLHSVLMKQGNKIQVFVTCLKRLRRLVTLLVGNLR
jgi:hypothetical protein